MGNRGKDGEKWSYFFWHFSQWLNLCIKTHIKQKKKGLFKTVVLTLYSPTLMHLLHVSASHFTVWSVFVNL